MKKLLFVFAFAIIGTLAIAQSQKIYIDGKLSTMEDARNLPASQIDSMSQIVENGTIVTRFMLKKSDTTVVRKPTVKDNTSKTDYSPLVNVGDKAVDFTAQKYSGGELKLSDYKGKVVLLNFWGSWCAPCLRELAPEGLPTVLAKFKDNPNFVFIPVAYKDTKEKLTAFFATENGKTIYNYLSPVTLIDNGVFSLYATSGVPRSFVIGADGKIVMTSVGFSLEELIKIEAAITTALK